MKLIRKLAFWRRPVADAGTEADRDWRGDLEAPFDAMWGEILTGFAASDDAGRLMFVNVVNAYSSGRVAAAVKARDAEWKQNLAHQAAENARIGHDRREELIRYLTTAHRPSRPNTRDRRPSSKVAYLNHVNGNGN